MENEDIKTSDSGTPQPSGGESQVASISRATPEGEEEVLVDMSPNPCVDATGKTFTVSEDSYVYGPNGELITRHALRKAKEDVRYWKPDQKDQNYIDMINIAAQALSNQDTANREKAAEAERTQVQETGEPAPARMRRILGAFVNVRENSHHLSPMVKAQLKAAIDDGYAAYTAGNYDVEGLLAKLEEIAPKAE